MKLNKHCFAIILAIVVTLPGLYARFSHLELSAPLTALVSGLAILGASFLLLWACEAAQTDIPQTLALAVVALIAVLPEYAVDMYFTWQAGRNPGAGYEHYAIANMTGANRLIIGVAWTLVAGIFWLKTRRAVVLGKERKLEVRFLAAATVYALLIPIKGSLQWYDGVVLVALYGLYVVMASRRPRTECEAEGPAACITSLPVAQRRAAFIGLFVFAAAVILANAERFSEGLLGTGKAFGINEFLLVQWLAPLASEAPEFVVAIMFAVRGQASLALGSLLSAKLNQWTLLVGMIPGVFAVASGTLAHPLPMDSLQMQEILLTAAQSLLAVVMVASLRLSAGQALLLFGLFAGQLVLPGVANSYFGGRLMGFEGEQVHTMFSLMYLTSAVALLVDHTHRLQLLWPFRRDRGIRPERVCDVCGAGVAAEPESDGPTAG